MAQFFERQQNLENNNPLDPNKQLDRSQRSEQALAGQFQENLRTKDMTAEEKKKVSDVESDIKNLMQHDDILEINARLRDPALRNFISDTLRQAMNEKVRTVNKEKVR